MQLVFSCFCAALCLGRTVKVPAGPLVRVEGTEVSIPCEVKDYEGPREQDFDWRVIRGDRSVQLISTLDSSFTDSSFRSRVSSREVTIDRTSENSVSLRIRNVKPSDSAAYDCLTPSTDSQLSGNYNATVRLIVIPDSLVVIPLNNSSQVSARVSEGRSFELHCRASVDFVEHTFLSVSWAVKRGPSTEKILTYGPGGVVRAESSYRQRYADGGLRLDLPGDGVYSLIVSHAVPSDEGLYVCSAAEWARDDGDTWTSIQEKQTELTDVKVVPIVLWALWVNQFCILCVDVVGLFCCLTQSFQVSAEHNASLSVGDALSLACRVAADSYDLLGLEVAWYVGSAPDASLDGARLLAHMSRDSVTNGTAAASLSRVSWDTFRLVVRDVGRADSGHYFCVAAAWVQHAGGQWYRAAERNSSTVQVAVALEAVRASGRRVGMLPAAEPQLRGRLGGDLAAVMPTQQQEEGAPSRGANVHLKPCEPSYSVILKPVLSAAFSDEPTELECTVTDVERASGVHMTVAWYFEQVLPSDAPSDTSMIALVDENWDLQAGDKYEDRVKAGLIVLNKVKPDTFKLQILSTRDTDRGRYFCTVTAWSRMGEGGWTKRKAVESGRVRVTWTQENPVLVVVATHLKTAFSGGDTFEMGCRVTGRNLQTPSYSALIKVEESLGGKVRKVVSLSRDSVMRLEDGTDKERLDSVVLLKTSQQDFRFRMYGTQLSDAGFYFCEATAWTPDAGSTWREAVTDISNKVRVSFEDTGVSSLALDDVTSQQCAATPGDSQRQLAECHHGQGRGPAFNVSIHTDTSSVFPGETAKIQCAVTVLGMVAKAGKFPQQLHRVLAVWKIERSARPQRDVSFEVSWFLERSRAADTEDVHFLASVDRWGVLRQAQRNSSSDCSLERTDAKTYRLSVHNAQDSDAGNYHCTVTPWVRTADGSWQKSKDISSLPVLLVVKFAIWESLKLPLLYGVGAALAVGLLSVLIGFVSARCCFKEASEKDSRATRRLMAMEMD
ncbi:FPRP regulator, partial [Atractosteus spatula]|nr:FPRP regulator [Atractosteus spatula]